MKGENIMNHPIDIAYSLKMLIDSEERNDTTESDLQEAVYQLKAIAENKYNADCWRVLYKAISAIADLPELSPLPF